MRHPLKTFEPLEVTRAFTESCVCDCGIFWRLMVLGGQQQRAGARAFLGGAEGGWSGVGWTGLCCGCDAV